ncbi:hypothetical protein LCGC14_0700050 [marine sediment metagenome]|uniref:Uncharacterized protein n=1 Tax=marine sediment metagenome TaxID=412755 RepID=A0A0F9R3E7_9ZZZZ
MEKPILFLNIPCPPGEKRVMGFQPLSLISLGSYLEQHGEKVVILDGRAEGLTFGEIIKRIKNINPCLVGISTFTPFIAYAYNFSTLLKKNCPDINILLGGPHINATYPETMGDCLDVDFCIYGEGEESLLGLSRAIRSKYHDYTNINGLIYRSDGKFIVNPPRSTFVDLNNLPPLNYNLIDNFNIRNYDSIFAMGKKAMAMVVSRGCPFRCTFCGAQVTHGRRVRYASVEKVVDEIEDRMSGYGIGYVSMKDSTFTVNRRWVIDFCRKLIKKKTDLKWGCNVRVDCIDEELLDLMVRSGLVNIGFGIESGTERILKVIKKGITIEQIKKTISLVKNYDLLIGAGFMLGNFSETLEEVHKTVKFAKELAIPLTAFSSTVVYPGTPLYKQAKLDNTLRSEKWYIKKDEKGNFIPTGLTAGNLKFRDYDSETEARQAYRKFYFNLGYLFNFIKLIIRRPGLVKYSLFYLWKIVKLVFLKRKSQHI